jgi:hypothetical protein
MFSREEYDRDEAWLESQFADDDTVQWCECGETLDEEGTCPNAEDHAADEANEMDDQPPFVQEFGL